MFRLFAFAFGFLMATATYAADLGKPAAAPAIAMFPAVPDQWTGAYFETGLAGRFVNKDDRAATGSAGVGYSYHAPGNPFVGGVFARYSFSLDADTSAAVLTFDQPVTIGASAGYLIQPQTKLYALAGYSFGKDDDRGLILGGGAETFVYKSLSLAAEYHYQMTDKGAVDGVHSVGIYLRHRF